MVERASLHVEEVQWLGYCTQFQSQSIDHQRTKYDFFIKKGAGRDDLPVKPTLASRYCLLVADDLRPAAFKVRRCSRCREETVSPLAEARGLVYLTIELLTIRVDP